MIAPPRPLIAVCAAMPDMRAGQGTRQPLSAILAMACGALVGGDRSESAIAEWGRNDGIGIAQALGLTHTPPGAATRPAILRHVERDALAERLGGWAARVVVSPPAASAGAGAGALDGKTRRGSHQQGAPGVPLVSALAHHVGLPLPQQAVDAQTTASTQVETG